jgi:hypothetical protein
MPLGKPQQRKLEKCGSVQPDVRRAGTDRNQHLGQVRAVFDDVFRKLTKLFPGWLGLVGFLPRNHLGFGGALESVQQARITVGRFHETRVSASLEAFRPSIIRASSR